MSPPSGCRFHTRCLRAEARCSTDIPELRQIPTGQTVSCHFAEEAQSTYTTPANA